MKRENKNIILIISMAFNIAFIGMFIYHAFFMPEFPEHPPKHNLKAMRNLVRRMPKDKKFHDRMKQLLKERRDKREEFMEMISKKNIDDKVLNDKLNQVIYLENKISKLTGKYMIKYRCQMGPEEFRDRKRNHKPRRRNEKD